MKVEKSKSKNLLVKSSVVGLLTLTLSASLLPANAATTKADMEKCYGIARAGMNDCSTKTQSCAGSTQKDGEPGAFLLVPKGLCHKIIGSNLTAPDGSK